LASLQTNGYDFELASATSDLTIENAFALSGGETLSTQGADLIFEAVQISHLDPPLTQAAAVNWSSSRAALTMEP